jgi:hypothetical protein
VDDPANPSAIPVLLSSRALQSNLSFGARLDADCLAVLAITVAPATGRMRVPGLTR